MNNELKNFLSADRRGIKPGAASVVGISISRLLVDRIIFLGSDVNDTVPISFIGSCYFCRWRPKKDTYLYQFARGQRDGGVSNIRHHAVIPVM